MYDCLYNRRTLYPVSHFFAPFATYLLTHNSFLTVSIFAAWELIEYIVFTDDDSYLIFPGTLESLCDVIILDLGNGFLGLFIAWWIQWCIGCNKVTLTCTKWLYTILFLVVWTLVSPLDFECEFWIFPCDYTAWGIPALSVFLAIYLWLLRSDDNRTLWVIFVVGLLYLNVTWIPVSTPLLVYATSIVMMIGAYWYPVGHRYERFRANSSESLAGSP